MTKRNRTITINILNEDYEFISNGIFIFLLYNKQKCIKMNKLFLLLSLNKTKINNIININLYLYLFNFNKNKINF